MTFCVTKWFQRRYGIFKRKNIISKQKKLKRMHVSFPFHHGSYVGGTFDQWVFKFCFCNQSTEEGSYFTLLYFTTCRKRNRKKLHSAFIQYQEPQTNVLRQKYLPVPADFLHLLKKILKENIPFHAVSEATKLFSCLELRLKKKSQLQKIILLRNFDFDFDTYLCCFLTHFHARWYQKIIHA